MKGKVLVIDDDQVTRRLLEQVLKRNDYDVQVAENGWEGLKALRKFEPDIIVLDIQMPVMDGFEFLEETETFEARKRTQIIVLTSLEDQREAMARAGVRDYMVKPFKMHELVEKLEKNFNTPGQPEQPPSG